MKARHRDQLECLLAPLCISLAFLLLSVCSGCSSTNTYIVQECTADDKCVTVEEVTAENYSIENGYIDFYNISSFGQNRVRKATLPFKDTIRVTTKE